MIPEKNVNPIIKAWRNRRYRIYIIVIAFHILAIGGPYVWWLMSGLFKTEPEKIIEIHLDNLPASDSPGGAAGGTPPPPNPEPPNPEPPTPEPPTPTPPQPTPPPPKPKPPVPKPPVVKPPKPQPPKPKQPEVKPPKEKPKEKPKDKPEKKYLDPKDILKTDKTVIKKNQPKKPNPDDKPYSPPGAQSDLKDRLDKALGNGVVGQPPGLGGGNPNKDAMEAAYGQLLAAYIKKRWNKPNQYELNHTRPSVLVRFTLSPSGNVIRAEIVEPSNIPAMDRSVIKLLNSNDMRMVPVPPPGVSEVEIRMQISD